ncbi:cornulin-like [Tamandua tetradactyla]|uniref:cornulin-like n=1 Tax=Tamandua tetradactyla TaxID=48850 RepID=UPI004053A0D7
MPQLLRHINGVIEVFCHYARMEGDGAGLTRGLLRRLVEQELVGVLEKPHDPATVDEVLRLLDEDDSGTVEFKEFLVLVFKVAQACFKALSESRGGACGSQQPRSCHPGASQELGEGQGSNTEVGRAGREQQREGRSLGQSEQAPGGQAGARAQTQGHDLGTDQGSIYEGPSGSQRQWKESQKAQERGHSGQTTIAGADQSYQTRGQRSDTQPQTREQERTHQRSETTVRGTITQTQTLGQDRGHQTGSTQPSESTCGQTQGQDRSQPSQEVTGGQVQTQAGSQFQMHTQAVGQDRSQLSQEVTGGQVQTQAGSSAQVREQYRAHQTSETMTGTIIQTQADATQTLGQDRGHQTGSTQPWESTSGQPRGTETQVQVRSQLSQVATGRPIQTQTGSQSQMHTQLVEQDRSQLASHTGASEQGETQMQSGSGPRWTQVSSCEAGGAAPEGQAQSGTSTLTERQDRDSSPPRCSVTGGQGDRLLHPREPSVGGQEQADDHTRETEIHRQGPGSLQDSTPSTWSQEAVSRAGKPGITVQGLYSYLKSSRP